MSEGVTLFSDIETSDLLSGANATLYKEENGAYVRDDFLHEQSALIRSGGKTALFAGCAHRGIVNILRRAEALCGKTPDWVLAGFHLNNAGTGEDEPEELVRAIGAQLDRRDAVFVTGHCTGEGPYKILKDVLGEKMRYMSSGTAFEL